MIAFSRFRVRSEEGASFLADASAGAAFFRQCAGCESADVVRNLDDPDLWAVVTRWADVGSYRRSFNGFDAKMVLVPLLSRAIEEPSAYDDAEHVGENLPRSG